MNAFKQNGKRVTIPQSARARTISSLLNQGLLLFGYVILIQLTRMLCL